jgi:hypothetical protein
MRGRRQDDHRTNEVPLAQRSVGPGTGPAQLQLALRPTGVWTVNGSSRDRARSICDTHHYLVADVYLLERVRSLHTQPRTAPAGQGRVARCVTGRLRE